LPISTKVEDIASRKLVTVREDDSVFDAVSLMVAENIGGIVVTSQGKPAGIITERDLMRKVILQGLDVREVPARSIMSSPLTTVQAGTSLGDAAALMQAKRIRRLLVEEQGVVTGILTQRDLERALLDYFVEISSIG
jgi:CBS domain-containing protein